MRFSLPTLILLIAPAALAAQPAADRTVIPFAGLPERQRELILAAGNADRDEVVLEKLEALRRENLPENLRRDVDQLIAEVHRWLEDPDLEYFRKRIWPKETHDFGLSPDSPLEPLMLLYRARMITWVALEFGRIWAVEPERRRVLDRARHLFEQSLEFFPANRLTRMYLGEPIPPQRQYSGVPGAPEWAIYQRESLERLTDIIEWWIDHRQRKDGQYGGGWGDDCEMWRWWVPVLIGFEHPKLLAAQRLLSEGLLAAPHMTNGYTDQMSDVEHTAEDSADTITPMMHLASEEPAWQKRALRIVELAEKSWIGRNERGKLQFKTSYMTAQRTDMSSARAVDTMYHPRIIEPALLYWQRTHDERIGKLMTDWMDTWIEAAASTDRGKPAGVLPPAIHWPDGHIGGVGADWFDPRNHGEYTLYLWPAALSIMSQTLLLTYHMTGEERYLEPIRGMARLRRDYLQHPPKRPPAPGTAAWCGAQLGRIAPILAKYRFLTGKTEFDDLLERDIPAYVRLRLAGDRAALTLALRDTADALAINFSGYTSEVRYTDRVLRFPALFDVNGMFPEPIATIRMPSTDLLYSSATGDPGDLQYFPMNAVRWLTPPRDIAALVTDATPQHLAAELFHFGPASRPVGAELYLLAPGEYTMTLRKVDENEPPLRHSEKFTTKTGARTRIAFELPPRTLCQFEISRSSQLKAN